jgi:uncharacterized protein
MIEHTPLVVAIAVVSAFTVGLSKGGLPSVGTLAVPLLAIVISPMTAAALLLPIYVASDMVGLYLYRRSYSGPNLAILIPSSLVGVLTGWVVGTHLSSVFIGMPVGAVGVLFCLNAWFGARYRQTAKAADTARLLRLVLSARGGVHLSEEDLRPPFPHRPIFSAGGVERL